MQCDLGVAGATTPQLLHPSVPLIDQRPFADKCRGRAALEAAGGVVELTRRERRTRSRARPNSLRGVIEVLHEQPDLIDEDLRARGWGLARSVRDFVGDAAVDLVPDTREHRHRHRGDLTRHLLGVEGTKVGTGATAAHEDDDVDLQPGELVERPHDAPRGRGTLHPHVDDTHLPRVATGLELVHEVVVGGAARARDQTHTERDRSEREPRVAIEQAVGRERAQHPLAVRGDPAHGEHGIDGAHDELELPLVRANPAADAHLHVVAELGARHFCERA